MSSNERLFFLDNLKSFLIFLVVLVHAGVVYESSGFMAPYWLVDDPSTSDLPGLVNLILEIFVMPTFFFISGYFTRPSLQKKGRLGISEGQVQTADGPVDRGRPDSDSVLQRHLPLFARITAGRLATLLSLHERPHQHELVVVPPGALSL